MPRKIKQGTDVAALLSSLDDYRAVIAAGKVQRWDVVKWAVTLNLAFATVSVIWDQKTPGLFAPRTIFFALASAVMVAAVALGPHTFRCEGTVELFRLGGYQLRQLSDVARHAPRFVHRQHIGCLGIGRRFARLDVGECLSAHILHDIPARNALGGSRLGKASRH